MVELAEATLTTPVIEMYLEVHIVRVFDVAGLSDWIIFQAKGFPAGSLFIFGLSLFQ